MQNAGGLGSPEDLNARLALIPPDDVVRGYFFNCILERIQRRGDTALLRRCLDTTGHDKFIAYFNYPMSAMLRLLYIAAEALKEEAGSFEKALEELGRGAAQDFMRHSVGKTLMLMAGRSPKRLADTMSAAYGTGWQHGRGTVSWPGPSQCTAYIHGNVVPAPYFEGIFREIFGATEAMGLKVEGRQVGLSETEYDISWDPLP